MQPITTPVVTDRPPAAPVVSIIVVNYNGAQHLDECLSAIGGQTYRLAEALLVDNNSSDGSPALVRERYPWVRVLASPANLGYAGAVNQALPEAAGRYIVVLNMDAMVAPGWLEPMVSLLDERPEVGAVSPKIVLYDRPDHINALGQNVHISALGFNRGYNRPDRTHGAGPFPVSGIHGAAFMIRRELLERMGGMNAACFLYHEEVDLSWLVRLMGYELYCVPASAVRHKYTLKMDPQKLFYLERNRVAMLLTNLEWATLALIAPFLLLTELMMAAYCLMKGPRFVGAKLRSLAWIWQRRGPIRGRRARVREWRRRTDREVLAGLRLMYEWDQLVTLGRQRRRVLPDGPARLHGPQY